MSGKRERESLAADAARDHRVRAAADLHPLVGGAPHPAAAARGRAARSSPHRSRCGPGASPKGMRRDDGDGSAARAAGRTRASSTSSPPTTGPAIFHLKDFHEPMRDAPEIRRRLRDLYESCFDRGKFVVISSPVKFIPEELEREHGVRRAQRARSRRAGQLPAARSRDDHRRRRHTVDTSEATLLPARTRPAGADARRSPPRGAPRRWPNATRARLRSPSRFCSKRRSCWSTAPA